MMESNDDHDNRIGPWLSIFYLVNQIFGPGGLAMPIVMKQAGWAPSLTMLLFFSFTACLASTMLCAAMRLIPGNDRYQRKMEYSSVVEHYYGPAWKRVFDVVLSLTLLVANIASAVIAAQAIDQIFLTTCGRTWALQLRPSLALGAFKNISILYSNAVIAISLGYFITVIGCIATSMQNLADNVKVVQTVSFFAMVILFGEFAVFFLWRGTAHDAFDPIPAFGDNSSQLVSVYIFSLAYIMYIPSWINEKQPDVSERRSIWLSGGMSCVAYCAVALLCAGTSGKLSLDNMLVKLSLPPTPTITIVCSFLIALLVIAPGVPVGAITLRYNLVAGQICGERASYFWAVFAPWLFAFVFCQGQSFAQLLTWSTLFLNSATNFLLPIMLYRTATTRVLDAAHVAATEGVGADQDGAEQSAVEETLVPAAVAPPLMAVELKTALVDDEGAVDSEQSGAYHALTDEAASDAEKPTTKIGLKSVHFFPLADAAPRSFVEDARRRSFIASSEGADKLVQPLLGESVIPEFLGITEQRAPFAALVVLIMTAALVALQIGYDVYFLVFEGKNVLAN